MKKPLLFFSIASLLSADCLATEQCETNFTREGSFFKGKKFSTWAVVEGVPTDIAFKKVYQHMAKDGWVISNSDKEIGIITASQNVSYGKSKTSSLNVVIEELGENSKISINYSLSGGVSCPEKAVIENFCKTISAANQN